MTFGFGVRNKPPHGPNSGAVFRAYPPQTHLSGAEGRLVARRSRRLPDLADIDQDTPLAHGPRFGRGRRGVAEANRDGEGAYPNDAVGR